MKILLILVILAICWNLYETEYAGANIQRRSNRPLSSDSVNERGLGSIISRVKRHNSAKRMEWRRMSVSMKKLFIKHFNKLAVKQTGEVKSRLQVFADWQTFGESRGAYRGPAFLPWHREFLFRFENALRDDGYPHGLPYWNSGLEYDLPDPTESAIFTTNELGASRGNLGLPFPKVKARRGCNATVTRNSGYLVNKNLLLHRAKVANLAIPRGNTYLMFARTLEMFSNGVNLWVGGHMSSVTCAGFDPLFYLHYCYVDYLWEQFRKKQKPCERVSYPSDTEVDTYFGGNAPEYHYGSSTMLPFVNKLVADGMSTIYTDVYYKYDHIPKRCTSDANCDGKHKGNLLWCNRKKCQSKIREGGECLSKLKKDNQCHCAAKNKKPKCAGNKCRCK